MNTYVDGAQWFTVNYQKASQTLRTMYIEVIKNILLNAKKLRYSKQI